MTKSTSTRSCPSFGGKEDGRRFLNELPTHQEAHARAARVSPVERVRAEIDQLFADPARDLGEVVEEVARLGARLLLQTALEAEVTAFLGRDRYQRRPDADPGYRNGHQPVTVKTTSGPVTLQRPKLCGTNQRFASTLLGVHVTAPMRWSLGDRRVRPRAQHARC
jgi:hypothetical protein